MHLHSTCPIPGDVLGVEPYIPVGGSGLEQSCSLKKEENVAHLRREHSNCVGCKQQLEPGFPGGRAGGNALWQCGG